LVTVCRAACYARGAQSVAAKGILERFVCSRFLGGIRFGFLIQLLP